MHPLNHKLEKLIEEYKERGFSNPLIRNLLKEYLQDIVLNILYNDTKYKDLIFYGGTCLRKLYNLNRLSEDLDFESLEPIDLEELKDTLLEYFRVEKFNHISASIQNNEKMNRCTLKFEILNTLGLSEKENEKLHVKVEIKETNLKYTTEYTPYSKDIYSMVVKHYTLPVLMSTKMLACANRVYRKGESGVNIKGRDFYDLVWYMQKSITPDEGVFKKNNLNSTDVFKKIDGIVKDIKYRDLIVDLEPLFDSNVYIKEWCKNFHSLYAKYRY